MNYVAKQLRINTENKIFFWNINTKLLVSFINKKMKMKNIKVLLIALTIIFLSSFNIVNAQTKSYGGSSYAYVKDNNGNKKIVYQIVDCIYSTEAEAKEKLKPIYSSNWQLDSQIYYSIDREGEEGTWYGATASARVRNKQGIERVVTSEVGCNHRSKPKAKEAAVPIKASSEEFITPIVFNISSCDK